MTFSVSKIRKPHPTPVRFTCVATHYYPVKFVTRYLASLHSENCDIDKNLPIGYTYGVIACFLSYKKIAL